MNKKILIVEDNLAIASDLHFTLQEAGYAVIGTASSLENAEQLLQDQKPDLVILDIYLEGKGTGIDLAKRLNEEDIAFIYLSENSSKQVVDEAKTTDPFGFLVKPFRETDLLVTLAIAFHRQKNAQKLQAQQEGRLQKQLVNIIRETADDKLRLLKLANVIRDYIPFDLIVSEGRHESADLFADFGYLRIGFDEFQYIGEEELINIGGLSRSGFSRAVLNSDPTMSQLTADDVSKENTTFSPLQKIWMDCFKISSSLKVTTIDNNGTPVTYCFHSREPSLYTQKHISILELFQSCFAGVNPKRVQAGNKTPNVKAVAADAATFQKPCRREFDGIIGQHPLLIAALELTAQVAPYNTSVLILGESGTGKEKVAHAVHDLSSRKNKPFVEVNCGAIPPALIESELFGHEKGAFTGATEKRKGRFEQADGGTVFLDEIGELPLDMQVKLLRVLQEKEINYVGSNTSKKVDVRIVAATNRNLEKEVKSGNFRLDLYYRLNVFPITLPPLRDRKSDIVSLITFFAHKFCKDFNKEFNGISTAMIDTMLGYQWPGNIRELENVLERSVILNCGDSELQLKQHLNGTLNEPSEKVDIETLQDVKNLQQKTEKAYIISVLKKTEGRIRGSSGAAELLNLKPTTLESRMAKLGIKKEDYANPADK